MRPAPVAMVWREPGAPHQAIAVPGVDLRDGEALVEVELATVCGSDVHTVRGDRPAPTPLVLGHEQVGRIVALGPGGITAVDGTVMGIGDRIVWGVTASCGTCDRCRSGLPQKCRHVAKYGHERLARGWELSGGFATHVQLRAGTAIVRVPESMAAALAAPAACSTATAVAALEAASRVPLDGTTVLVAGAGMIGLAATAMAADAGANVIVVDPDAARRRTAESFGAELTLDPAAGPLDDRVRQRGLPAPLAAIEASGSAAAVQAALRSVDIGGVVVLVGSVSPGPGVQLDPEAVVRGLLTVTGVHNYAPRHLQRAIDYLASSPRAAAFGALVGTTYPLAELDRALAAAANGAHVRVGIDPRRVP
ncbi:alcohol dehydrogenase catalytic domain-containing protein [Agromyces sp. SYSU K20354]|uniref:alcohol dehydrogenase catalytic domain-containing protein n=1 Tax=Agromyces cavernae TaxID=2898659 RepID=UPI001E555928|nr:alcohol dehydrogenase catalytic domain-containing protein [Agromyces cavernae]MCD2440798.1 alcohol dehydrogenase catalytic domain-containing protein [Agromyces cavernae]